MGAEEKIKELEELISKTKYNKKTQHAIGLYKAQIAKLKEKQFVKASKKSKREGYFVKKTGDATAVLLGFPSVGKSTLLNAITDARSRVAAYEFTTLSAIPGMMEHQGAKIQILDVPGILYGAASGKGRGKEVLSVIKVADLVLILLDATKPENNDVILKEIYEADIRINQEKPDIRIKKTAYGGIKIGSTVKHDLTEETIKDILKEFRITNAEVLIRTPINIDSLIDVVEDNRKYIPAIIILNKIDLVDKDKLERLRKKLKPHIEISAEKKINLEELKELVFKKLNFIRIYMKEIGKEPDMKEPLIMKDPITIENVCTKIHRDFVNKLKFARIWGKSAKFPGQRFQLNHKLQDEDVVEIHLR